jgi:hypothetical protein
LWNRILHKALFARPDPVVLKKGAILKLSVRPGSPQRGDGRLFAQVSGLTFEDTNLWKRPEPGVAITRQLGAGSHTVRAIQLDTDGSAWFSDVVTITATAEQTNEMSVKLERGATVRGKLDAIVPRPVRNGRVVANVWPAGHPPKDGPPEWHDWATVREDGSFEIRWLPPGDLEIVALCNGFVSTNGPGRTGMRYPQKHVLGTNDMALVIGMEPTARLEVRVTDDQGKPLEGARVETWPNIRYGEWGARILMSDCFNMADWLRLPRTTDFSWARSVPDFEGVSDRDGLAVIPNLPATVKQFSVEHPRFTLPALGTPGGGKHRAANITLIAGETNRASVQLEPREEKPITHY